MFKKFFGKESARSLTVSLDPRFLDGEMSKFFVEIEPSNILEALKEWSHLDCEGVVIAVTAFGDVFLQSGDGSVTMLDTLEGNLRPLADSPDQLFESLSGEAAQDELLLAGFVIGAISAGKHLGENECYDFIPPPMLGGPIEQEHLETTDFSVKMSIAGQIHRQVKDLPPGTPIGEITIS